MNLTAPWNRHYQKEKSRQHYPDENLVRLLAGLQRSGMDFSKSSVLDYGFGSGRHLQLLREFGFQGIAGCEISHVAFQHCQEAFPDLKLHLLKESNDVLPFSSSSFDVIVCWGVIHYLDREAALHLLQEFRRLLTPGGALIGTLRSDRDTHFLHSDVSDASIKLYSEDQARSLLAHCFHDVQLGHMERTPLDRIQHRIAHWFFQAKNN